MKYKVGDKVLIRQWDDMANMRSKLNSIGDIEDVGGCYFTRDMRKFCGSTLIIENVSTRVYRMKGNRWNWTDDMIERKVDMTKADLKDGMVCRTRDGKTFIWLDGIARNNTHVISCTSDDLKNELGITNCEIVEVYKTRGHILTDMLDVDRFGTLIWKREEPKKMTLVEIEKALGYPVKIVMEGDKC